MSEHSRDNYEDWSLEKTLVYQVELVVVPALVVTGILGNLTSAWVLSVSSLRGLSSSFYLASLTASDTGFLASLLFVWLKEVGFDVYNTSGWCQGITFVCHVTTFLSVWLVVAFTVERFVAVCFPLLRPRVCTVSRAKMVVAFLSVVACALYSYILLAAGTVYLDGKQHCTLKSAYQALGHVMNLVDLVVTLILPLILIISLNLKIARCVKFIEKLRPQLAVALAAKSQPSQLRVTKALLIISTVFVFLNLPSYCVRAYVFFAPPEEANQTLYTVTQAAQMLFYANFAVNFQLYCVAGQNFRSAVVAVWQGSCLRRNANMDFKATASPLQRQQPRRCFWSHSSLLFLASLSRSFTSKQSSGAVEKFQPNSIPVISKAHPPVPNKEQAEGPRPCGFPADVGPEFSRSLIFQTVMQEQENSLPTILRVQILASSDIDTTKLTSSPKSNCTRSPIHEYRSIPSSLHASPAKLPTREPDASETKSTVVREAEVPNFEHMDSLALPSVSSALVSNALAPKNYSSENISTANRPVVLHNVVLGSRSFSSMKPPAIVSLSTLSGTLFTSAVGLQAGTFQTDEPKSAQSNPEFFGNQFSYQSVCTH